MERNRPASRTHPRTRARLSRYSHRNCCVSLRQTPWDTAGFQIGNGQARSHSGLTYSELATQRIGEVLQARRRRADIVAVSIGYPCADAKQTAAHELGGRAIDAGKHAIE